jgi:hypothetical protein
MSQELHQLAQGQGPIAQRAQYALQLTEAFQNGQISQSEYNELLQDLIRTDVLESEADDIQLKTMLVYGVSTLIKFV